MKGGSFEKSFSVRSAVCFFIVFCLLLFCVLRVAAIDMKDYAALQKRQSSLVITAAYPRGSILDRNGTPLTNSKLKTIAAINPTPAAINAVKTNLSGAEQSRVLRLLEAGECAVCTLDRPLECEGVACVTVPVRITENTVAHHTVGYLDGGNSGADGIERAYNGLLCDKSALSAVFTVNGRGRVLPGVAPEFTGGTGALSNAVWLTIDINIQKRVEEIARDMQSGAVIVAQSKTNKILAAVSLPDFSPYDISESLEAESSPLMNKCLNCYNAGSVFKPCVAAAAIEAGLEGFTENCTGGTVIENRIFNCHNRQGHGLQTLRDAIKNSCNCYFYRLAVTLGKEKLYNAAERFSFGSKIKLADNYYAAAGFLPGVKELESESDTANFGIGQGDILLSPVSMLCLYGAIANGGRYYRPSVVEKTVKGGKTADYDTGAPTVAMSKETANVLKSALIEVVESGTGAAAKSEKTTAAGKTATAQTGRVNAGGREITNSWFCGFFPAEAPEYTVIVLADGEYKKSPAAVFREISELLS